MFSDKKDVYSRPEALEKVHHLSFINGKDPTNKSDDVFKDSRIGTAENEVLEGLRSSEKLSRLEIKCYNGTKLPSWMGDPTFDCLIELVLDCCKSCTCLPTLGQLPALKTSVKKMDGLKSVGSEFLRPSNSCHSVAFPSFEVLRFSDMKEWEEWSTSSCDKVEAFPCSKLKDANIVISMDCFTQVDIKDCPSLESYNCSKGIETLIVDNCPSFKSLTFQTMDDLPFNLKNLSVTKCDNMEVSCPLNNLLSSLEYLCIYSIPNLRLFPEGCLVNLIELRIEKCDNRIHSRPVMD
ncbi:hypothetical protein QVD17_39029 [Tagetes erecta]|uniref:R13L1/DRL21-like LRR repeat region domain-containing protein n=1 Tax=Tagetes erecta TaxID=13708 RepID=A0AAD8JPY3_TARER|nr:hypothetical protein QVD17_39029 [Tagetes erecta]